jgi:pimeloyl-ACP methyl ester carboxylesterase
VRTAIAIALCIVTLAALADDAPIHASGTTSSGAAWVADVPQQWNGTLLLWSRGYSPAVPAPDNSSRGSKDALLAKGYALLGSAYSAGGWSIQEAVPDQLAAIDAFTERFHKPKRVLAWGASMGGLITVALTEQHPERINGGFAMCGSIGGALGMMNMALDGAFAFKALVAPSTPIQLVNIRDDRENAKNVSAALTEAQATAQGRARIALAGVLAGIPGWTKSDSPRPADDDYDAQEAQVAASFVMGTFLPRVDQEMRAGGAFSWNEGVDYSKQLDLSGRRKFVAALYEKAGLDLQADLKQLNDAQRITAQPQSIEYMARYYTPTGHLKSPLLALQATGDGLTSPSLQRAYVELATQRSGNGRVAALWSERAGHCTFSTAEALAGIRTLEQRVTSGHWNVAPKAMNDLAHTLQPDGDARFISHTPAPMLRPCPDVKGKCEMAGKR